jgi:uncharacterized protein YmfQ (DUF2313 family)
MERLLARWERTVGSGDEFLKELTCRQPAERKKTFATGGTHSKVGLVHFRNQK